MNNDQDLFGMTFEQQVNEASGQRELGDISPNRRIPAEISFEPVGTKIQVTAYGADNEIIFRQTVKKTGINIEPSRVKGEVIFEPLEKSVRVTARDEQHKMLWGYIGTKESLRYVHSSIAIYQELQDLLGHELAKAGVIVPETLDPLKQASNALRDLQDTVDKLRDCVMVQKAEEATENRARLIARIAGDANRFLDFEMSSVGPMPQVAKDRAVEIAKSHYVTDTIKISDWVPPEDFDKKAREELTRKCWLVQISPVCGKDGISDVRVLGIAKKDGTILYDSRNNSPV